jgi:hypothetical protein
LYVDGEEVGFPNEIAFGKKSKKDVLRLAQAVKEEYRKTLDGISAAELKVYSWNGEPLVDSEEIITSLYGGDSWKHAIRVAAGAHIQSK